MPRKGRYRQSVMFAEAPPAQAHSPTSVAAAESVKSDANRLRQVVLDWLRRQAGYGGTDEEGIEATGLSGSTFRPRRVELWRMGLVEDTGLVRKVRSGRHATVWAAR